MKRKARRRLWNDNRKRPASLTAVPRGEWPSSEPDKLVGVFESRKYLVQVYQHSTLLRVSVNKTMVKNDGKWCDGISWDELQSIKRQIGMGDKYAVEVYPRDLDVVNVANMRHLWVCPKPLPIGWMVEE